MITEEKVNLTDKKYFSDKVFLSFLINVHSYSVNISIFTNKSKPYTIVCAWLTSSGDGRKAKTSISSAFSRELNAEVSQLILYRYSIDRCISYLTGNSVYVVFLSSVLTDGIYPSDKNCTNTEQGCTLSPLSETLCICSVCLPDRDYWSGYRWHRGDEIHSGEMCWEVQVLRAIYVWRHYGSWLYHV